MAEARYDVAVIGAGAAGVQAAKLAAQKKLTTILFDTAPENLGGTCLNKGCVPTKHYIYQSLHRPATVRELYSHTHHLLDTIRNDLLRHLTKIGVRLAWGRVRICDEHVLAVGERQFWAKHIIIATGSLPREIIPVDNAQIIFAEEVFSRQELPQKILIIGAGYIGMEMACLLHGLGKNVVVIEKESSLLPASGQRMASRLGTILAKRGIRVVCNQDASRYDMHDFGLVLLAAGRMPRLPEGLASVGLQVNPGGWLAVNTSMQTSIPHIYACGDISGKKLLAYVAEEHARIAVSHICGEDTHEDFLGLPECVFTQPQFAYVGISQEQARAAGIDCTIKKTNFFGYSAAHVYADTEGFLEIVADANGVIIGAGIISSVAAEIIGIFALAVRFRLTVQQVGEMTFIHPTISEIITDICK